MKRHHSLFTLILCICILSVCLACACSPNTPSNIQESNTALSSSAAPPSSAVPSAPENQTEETTQNTLLYKTPVPEDTLVNVTPGGTLRFGMRNGGVSQIGYAQGKDINTSWDYIVSAPVIETLARYNSKGELTPWLAKSWETNSEALTVTLNLQENVFFHDETPFNADAVIWNFKEYTRAGISDLKNVSHYEALDDHTVLVHLSSWDSAIETKLLYRCGFMISPTACQSQGIDWTMANPVGTGPFKFVSWERDLGINYVKNDNYWIDGLPYLDAIEIKFFSDVTTLSAAMLTGEIDCACPADAAVALAWADKGGVTEIGGSTNMTFHNLMFPSNNPESPFYDVRVRQAVAHAIDTEAIANIMSEQGGAYTAVKQCAIENTLSYNDQVIGYDYNPEKAKQLLEEAGYPDGFTCPGYVISANALLSQCSDIVQAYLAEVGIQVQNQNNDMALINEMQAGTGKQLDGIVWYCNALTPDVSTTLAQTFTDSGNSYATVTLHTEDVVQCIDNATSAKTTDELQKANQELVKLLIDEYCFIIPIAMQYNGQSVTPYLHNLNYATATQFLWTPEITWMEAH